MTASYSASLLEAWNPNLSTYSISIPSGEVRISPASLPYAFVAPSTESLQMGVSNIALGLSYGHGILTIYEN